MSPDQKGIETGAPALAHQMVYVHNEPRSKGD